MPTLSDLARRHTALDDDGLDQLHSLVSDWQLLADLSFADLVLWLPRSDGIGWIAVAQMRPTTGPTVHVDDVVGRTAAKGELPLIETAWLEHRICREGDPDWSSGVPVREETIPIRGRDGYLGVIQRSTNLASARTPSRLELTYLQSASDLAQMVAEGRFPFPGEEPTLVRSPRVGDGLLRLDRSGRVTYASPNALSAYRRLGLAADLVGSFLDRVTVELCYSDEPVNEAVPLVAGGKHPRETEISGRGAVIQMRAIPLIVTDRRIGALVLLRDVTELRRREQELLTKDATIREIHHRVKNNLQTVAALLRLQARRLQPEQGRAALEEAVRRVGSIAIVHETLSHTPEELVDFDDIADRVITMVAEVSAPEARVRAERSGSFGVLPAEVATPLAMVLTELLQNAVQHGLDQRSGTLAVTATHEAGRLEILISDDGRGFPPGFEVHASTSLGLQIVRTLVEGELGGKLAIDPRDGGGTNVALTVPLPSHP